MIEPRRERRRRSENTGHIPVMPGWSIWVGSLVLLGVAAASMWLLLSLFGGGNEQDKLRLEIIKLAGSIVVGTGGGAALLLAARRQRSTELGLAQSERDLKYKEQAAADTRLDSRERRITELYASAAEQLSSDKAPVRLAGLYALERLGEISPDLRQTIVNLLCAYLRMPYRHPIEDARKASETEDSHEAAYGPQETSPLLIELAPKLAAAVGVQIDGKEQLHQEMQVRSTAQRLLSEHLEFVEGRANRKFWGREDGGGLDLDLQGATLDSWVLSHARIRNADLSGARFYGNTIIKNCHFQGDARFDRAKFFAGLVDVSESKFAKKFTFEKVEFEFNMACFDGSEFLTEPSFREVTFPKYSSFERSIFHAGLEFPPESFPASPGMKGARVKVGGNAWAFLPSGWTLGQSVGPEIEGWREVIRDED